MLGSDLAGLIILDILAADVTRVNSDIGPGGDADEVAYFLATLGIAMEDWLVAEENPHANSRSDQSTPPSSISAITRYGLNNECLQQQKPGLREMLCPQAGGLAGAGARGGSGVGIIAGKASGGFGSGIGNPGMGNPSSGGSGIGSPSSSGPGTGSPGGGNPGIGPGPGDPGTGSNGPGHGSGGPDIDGNDLGSGNGGGGDRDVITVPEPTTHSEHVYGTQTQKVIRTRGIWNGYPSRILMMEVLKFHLKRSKKLYLRSWFRVAAGALCAASAISHALLRRMGRLC